MRKFIIPALLLGGAAFLSAGSVSDAKIETISRIIRHEFNRVKSPLRPEKWQIYENTNDPKIKAAVYAQVQKQVKPFETKTKIVGIPGKVWQQIKNNMSERFPYKTPDEIAQGAIKEAEREFPLAKEGDEVTIRYYRNRAYQTVSGKVQSVRDGGRTFEVGNRLIRVSEIRNEDRIYFDPGLNRARREKFVDYYKQNFEKLKRDYRNKLISDEAEKMTDNEKNGYIFFRGNWRTAKFVTDSLYNYYRGVANKRRQVESTHFLPKTRPAPPKKK